MFGFTGCSAKKYRVNYDGAKSSFIGAKDKYRAGEKVKLYYMLATDTDYTFLLDGERINVGYDEEKGAVIEFTMPERDVTLSVESKNSMTVLPPDELGFEDSPQLSFSSFDGGGPEYEAIIENPEIVQCSAERDYGSENHEELDGASFNMIFTFKGLKAGTTVVKIEGRSPIAGDEDYYYDVTVNDALQTKIVEREAE